MKKPEAGEWMQSGAERARVVGFRLDGWAVLELKNGFICAVKSLEEYDVLPYCTGWDWQPETFPQWWTTNDVQNPDDESCIAFVIRSGPAEFGDWYTVQRNGRKTYLNGCIWNPEGRTQLTQEQAEALLTPKPEPKTRTVTLTLFLCWDREGEEELRWRIDPPLEWNYRHNTGETKTIEVPI